MDPITAGILSAAAYDVLKGTYSWLVEDSVSDSIDTAARRTADEYEYITVDHFHVLHNSDAVAEWVTEFKSIAEPIPPEWLGRELASIADPDLAADPTEVAESFLRNVERELSDHPELWRRVHTRYSQEFAENLAGMDEDLSEMMAALDELRAEVVRLREQRGGTWIPSRKSSGYSRRTVSTGSTTRTLRTATRTGRAAGGGRSRSPR